MHYEDWNALLTTHFFNETAAHTPVYLFVDDDLLREISPPGMIDASAHDPVADFETAVRTVIYGNDPFGLIFERTLGWRDKGRPGHPPFVGVLAATVLAASRMTSAPGVGRGNHSFYRPLRRILKLPGTGIPEGYDVVIRRLWEELETWLNDHGGRYGSPTAHTHSTLTYVGWALSQSVLSRDDHDRIVDFLHEQGPASRKLDTESLIGEFEVWAYRHHITQRLRRALTDKSTRLLVGEVIQRELESSGRSPSRDSTAASSSHNRRPPGAFSQNPAPLRLTWPDDGMPDGVAIQLDSVGEDIKRQLIEDGVADPHTTGWVELFSQDEITPGKTFTISVAGNILTLPGRDCYVLEADELLGVWREVPYAEVGIEHRVLVREELAQQAKSVMSECGSQRHRSPRRVPVPEGWVGFSEYIPKQAEDTVMDSLGALAPPRHHGARLVGGLPLTPHSNEYLPGGVPDLVVPVSPCSGNVGLTLQGRPLNVAEARSGGRVILSEHIESVGSHTIEAGPRSLTINVTRGQRNSVPSPSLVLPLRQDGMFSLRPHRYTETRHDSPKTKDIGPEDSLSTTLCGALISPPSRSPVPPRPRSPGIRGEEGSLPELSNESSEVKTTSWDLLLEWCSEYGNGTFEAFRRAHDWLSERYAPCTGKWSRTLSRLQRLGHVEVDWEYRRWSVAPTVLATLSDEAHMMLVGARSRRLLERIDHLAEEEDPHLRALAKDIAADPPRPQRNGPPVRMVSAEGRHAQELCSFLGIGWAPRAAEQLAARLPTLKAMLDEGQPVTGPAGENPHFLRPEDPEPWQPVTKAEQWGAYQYEGHGKCRYAYHIRGTSFIADKHAVIYAGLFRSRRRVVSYDPEHRELRVDARFPLPLLHARAAILSSGTLPRYERSDRAEHSYQVHPAIEPRVADQIIGSLQQDAFDLH
ncbi:hypothetical protein [Haloactinospora alba]|nr:hypothetical protein [Haloactinospora alba]